LRARYFFAPAGARLAAGTPLNELGAPHDAPIIRRTPEAKRLADGAVAGEVIAVDRFGNLITNLIAPRGGVVEIAGRSLPIVRTYAEVASETLTALVGSSGLVEVAVRDGSAARVLSAARGTPVVLRPVASSPVSRQ
jgi:S-adenosylmethionine hydrolase